MLVRVDISVVRVSVAVVLEAWNHVGARPAAVDTRDLDRHRP